MPTVNLYNIVTNDEYEIPVACDLVGARAVGEYLGMNEAYVRRCLCTGKWSHLRDQKAVQIGVVEITERDRKRKERIRNRKSYMRRKEKVFGWQN